MARTQIAVFSAKPYDRHYLTEANQAHDHDLSFLEARLEEGTALLARGKPVVSIFVNDDASADVLAELVSGGTRLLALRSAGFNHVDLDAAAALGLEVVRVPEYSPHAVAEFTVGMILTLGRKYHRAQNRVREGNFSLEGLMGFDLHQQTVGIIGTGKIGHVLAKILRGFGCEVVAHDPYPSEDTRALGVTYTDLDALLARSDIITLQCPLTPETHHLINQETLKMVKPGVVLINTSRGALIDTEAVIEALKDGRIGHLGLDVYEEESELFFEDHSSDIIQDDVFSRLLTFPNVLVTGHQAFFTHQAMTQIAATTLANVSAFVAGHQSGNEVGSVRG
jgi:D-lactate dehydrogenase